MIKTFWNLLTDIDTTLLYSRKDANDPRMGELVLYKRKDFSSNVEIGIVGVPDDEGVKRNFGRVGAKYAPAEIRRAFYKLMPFSFGIQKLISELCIFDFGDVKIEKTLEETHENLQKVITELIGNNILPIVLGGGHDIAYPNFLGVAKNSTNVGVINIDAHLDFRKLDHQRNSGTSFRQILEYSEKKILPTNFVEFGIQSFVNSYYYYKELVDSGANIIPLSEIQNNGLEPSLQKAFESATKKTDSLYISFDMDAVKSSDAPGVSAPSPSGLCGEDFLCMARCAGTESKVKLIDIVEVNPLYDIDRRSAKLAGLTMMSFLEGILVRKNL